jgi:hypothetical protein
VSDLLTVPANEHHVVRVFALDVPRDEAMALRDGAGRDRAIGALLGLDRIDPAHVEIVDPADLEGIGLAGLLTEGHGADEAAVEADRQRLDGLTGYAMILGSAAFGGRAAVLRPAAEVTPVGAYREDVAPVRFEPLPDAGAEGSLAPALGPATTGAAGFPWRYVGAALIALVLLLVLVRLLAG